MQFTSCPVYCAPSSSPLMVSPHLHDLESEGILCLFFLNPLPVLSLVLLYCLFFLCAFLPIKYPPTDPRNGRRGPPCPFSYPLEKVHNLPPFAVSSIFLTSPHLNNSVSSSSLVISIRARVKLISLTSVIYLISPVCNTRIASYNN